jgi:hypothetical protein
MKSAEDIRRYFQKSTLSTNPDRHEAVFEEIQRAQNQSRAKKPALTGINTRSKIMKSPIVKLAAAAVIIALVVLGLFELTGTESTSGVVWAEVARKVEASRGLIFRCTDLSPSSEDDYSTTYTSPRYCRRDFYKDGQITRTCYLDFTGSDTDTLIDVYHIKKFYVTTRYKKAGLNGVFPEQHEGGMNPSLLVQTILSCEHSKLGQKTIEEILCEGIKTTDPACLGPLPEQVNNLQVEFRLWVSTETGYPVLFERRMSGEHEGQVWETESVMDQFQWDVELDPGIFEPNIPPDYEGVTRPGIVEP